MNTKTISPKLLLIFLLGSIIGAACRFDPANAFWPTDVPSPVPDLIVITPDQAREIAIDNIRRNHGFIPLPDFQWSGSEIPSAEASSDRSFLYTSDQWVVTVSFEMVLPEDRIFKVIVINDVYEFNWNDLVDAYGNNLETSVDLGLFFPTATKATETPTVTQPTNTHIHTATSLPTATPTSTPTLIFNPTPTPMPCNTTNFIEDVTIVDGAAFAPNTNLTKIWRLKNAGTCAWTTAYDLVHVDGFWMGAPRRVALPESVHPGERLGIPVPRRAPQATGDYQGEDGRIHQLGEWIEVYDQQVTTINVNLSDLAGETVLFILGMEANTRNVEDA